MKTRLITCETRRQSNVCEEQLQSELKYEPGAFSSAAPASSNESGGWLKVHRGGSGSHTWHLQLQATLPHSADTRHANTDSITKHIHTHTHTHAYWDIPSSASGAGFTKEKKNSQKNLHGSCHTPLATTDEHISTYHKNGRHELKEHFHALPRTHHLSTSINNCFVFFLNSTHHVITTSKRLLDKSMF